jgi:hypothetical protein
LNGLLILKKAGCGDWRFIDSPDVAKAAALHPRMRQPDKRRLAVPPTFNVMFPTWH